MAEGEQMPKVDFKKQAGSINKRTLQLMEEVDAMNRTRLSRLSRMRHNSKITAGLIVTGLFSIYAYSMYAVKQETFLDQLDDEVLQQKARAQH